MEKGHVLRRLENEPAPQIISFQSYPVDLNRLEQRVDQVAGCCARASATPSELLRPDTERPAYSRPSPGRFTSELHERLSRPALCVRILS